MTTDIDLKSLVRTIPDYPKPGIMFRDVTTLFGHASGLRASVERLLAPFQDQRVEAVVPFPHEKSAHGQALEAVVRHLGGQGPRVVGLILQGYRLRLLFVGALQF